MIKNVDWVITDINVKNSMSSSCTECSATVELMHNPYCLDDRFHTSNELIDDLNERLKGAKRSQLEDIIDSRILRTMLNSHYGKFGEGQYVKVPINHLTVDAVEVVHASWIDRYSGKYANPAYDCSKCKKSAPFRNDMNSLGNWSTVQYLTNYCPNCGAKMDGDGNEAI